jgi:hypothetical protein
MLLEHRDVVASESPYHDVDSLYIHVLGKAVGQKNPSDVIDLQSTSGARLRLVAGTLVLLLDRLTTKGLTSLLGINEISTVSMLRRLTAVLVFDESNKTSIRIFHQSFRDFLVDPKRCTEPCFYVDPSKGHRRLAHRCLVLMSKRLHYNICSIQDPSASNADVIDSARIDVDISAELQYACTHWMSHLSKASFGDEALAEVLLAFCKNHLLHWLEVLSLIQKLRFGLNGLPKVQMWCKVSFFRKIYNIVLLISPNSCI